MIDLPDLSLVHSFAIVAQELNFRRAAERLAIDQSALSRRIQKLEANVGYPLLERTTREVMLTRAGLIFYNSTQRILTEYTRSVAETRRVAQGRTGQLRVGYMAFAATRLIPHTVRRYVRDHPDIAVELRYMRTQGQKLALANDELDIGFMIGPYYNSEFHSMELAHDQLCVVMPMGHRLLSHKKIHPADLEGEALVLGDKPEWGEYRYRLDDLFSQSGIQLAPAFEASNTLALVGLVAAGLGVTIYPETLLGMLSGAIDARPISHPAFISSTILVWKRNNRNRAVLNFVDAAKQCSLIQTA